MSFWPILVVAGSLIVFLTAVQLIINRGKINLRSYLQLLLSGLPPALPPFITGYFELKPDFRIYLPIVLLSLLPAACFLGKDIIKRRIPLIWPAQIFLGGVLIEFLPLYPKKLMLPLTCVGGLLIFTFLLRHFRKPYLNPMWLHSVAMETGKEVTKRGKYSSKPIVIYQEFEKKFSVGTMHGLYIIFKKDKAILKISKSLHNELGQPNLKTFSELLLSRISDYL